MEPIVRRAVISDAEHIASFNCSMALETEGVRLDCNRVLDGVRALLRDDTKGFYLLALDGGQPVGQAMITHEWSDWRNGVFWWIQSVYVDPHFRKRGIFMLLFRTLTEEAHRTPGICGLRLYVDRDNASAQKTYEKLGMKKTEYEIFETDFVLQR